MGVSDIYINGEPLTTFLINCNIDTKDFLCRTVDLPGYTLYRAEIVIEETRQKLKATVLSESFSVEYVGDENISGKKYRKAYHLRSDEKIVVADEKIIPFDMIGTVKEMSEFGTVLYNAYCKDGIMLVMV